MHTIAILPIQWPIHHSCRKGMCGNVLFLYELARQQVFVYSTFLFIKNTDGGINIRTHAHAEITWAWFLVIMFKYCQPCKRRKWSQAAGILLIQVVCNMPAIWFMLKYKVCQMLSWRTKNSSHFINIWDTVTNLVPLHSVYQAPSYELILTFLAPFPTELAYLSMLFILEVLCTAPQE